MISGRGVIDFGTTGSGYATVTVTGIPASSVKADQEIFVQGGMEATNDHTIDEHRVESIRWSADTVVENTSFRVVAVDSNPVFSKSGKYVPIRGKFSFVYMFQ